MIDAQTLALIIPALILGVGATTLFLNVKRGKRELQLEQKNLEQEKKIEGLLERLLLLEEGKHIKQDTLAIEKAQTEKKHYKIGLDSYCHYALMAVRIKIHFAISQFLE